MARLKHGARGKEVEALQKRLSRHADGVDLVIDGIFGDRTHIAVKAFQKKYHLKPTGMVTPETTKALEDAEKGRGPYHDYVFFEIRGKKYGVPKEDKDKVLNFIAGKLKKGPLWDMRSKVTALRCHWDHHDDLRNDGLGPLISFCIETTSGADFPPESDVKAAEKAYRACEAALDARDLPRFKRAYEKGEPVVNRALQRMKVYMKKTQEGGDDWVEGLQFTRDASFLVVGTIGVPAAGAALGASAASTAVVGGAAWGTIEQVGREFERSATDANWSVGGAISRSVINGGASAIVGRLTGGAGGTHVVDKLGKSIATRLAKRKGFQALSKSTISRFSAYVAREGGKNAIESMVTDIGKMIQGDPKMTWDKLTDNIARNIVLGAAFGKMGEKIEKFVGEPEKFLSDRTRQKIFDRAARELSRRADGQTIFVGAVDRATKARMEGIINKSVSGVVKKWTDRLVGGALDEMKGEPDEKKLERALQKQLDIDKIVEEVKTEAVREAERTILKKRAKAS
jgi:hypothetical protein